MSPTTVIEEMLERIAVAHAWPVGTSGGCMHGRARQAVRHEGVLSGSASIDRVSDVVAVYVRPVVTVALRPDETDLLQRSIGSLLRWRTDCRHDCVATVIAIAQ